VFATFAQENQNVQRTLQLFPGALSKTERNLGKLATAFNVQGQALHDLLPFASGLAPAEEALRPFFKTTTPIFKNDIRPFAREIQPTVAALQPSLKDLAASFPKLASSFSVLNELFNELAYNPGKTRAGFGFFAAWAAHNLNSVVSSADAHGVLARTLVYLNCGVLPLLAPAATINPTVNMIVGLVNPPTKAACQAAGILKTATATSARGASRRPAGGPFSALSQNPFGGRG
jgi:phospholipid/cholesterol/gamma-HCH transport system substrate-binding protein